VSTYVLLRGLTLLLTASTYEVDERSIFHKYSQSTGVQVPPGRLYGFGGCPDRLHIGGATAHDPRLEVLGQPGDLCTDVIPNPANFVDIFSFWIRQRPVVTLNTGHVRACLSTSQRDEKIRVFHHLLCQLLRVRGAQVDPYFLHHLHDLTMQPVQRAGLVPADKAFAFVGATKPLKKAAAICERPALCTQAKMTLFIARPYDIPA
jgi:hypothetical protein